MRHPGRLARTRSRPHHVGRHGRHRRSFRHEHYDGLRQLPPRPGRSRAPAGTRAVPRRGALRVAVVVRTAGEERVDGESSRSVAVYELGTTSYGEVHRLQQRLQAQRREGSGADTLLLTEHRPVFHLRRHPPTPDLRVSEDLVRQYGIEIVQTERGGDITYHGPGQLVV